MSPWDPFMCPLTSLVDSFHHCLERLNTACISSELLLANGSGMASSHHQAGCTRLCDYVKGSIFLSSSCTLDFFLSFIDLCPIFNRCVILCIVLRKHRFAELCKPFRCWHISLYSIKKPDNTIAYFIITVLIMSWEVSWLHNHGFQIFWLLPRGPKFTISNKHCQFFLKCQA